VCLPVNMIPEGLLRISLAEPSLKTRPADWIPLKGSVDLHAITAHRHSIIKESGSKDSIHATAYDRDDLSNLIGACLRLVHYAYHPLRPSNLPRLPCH
jgi:hypothetical protein